MQKKVRFFWRLLLTFFVRRKQLIFLSSIVGVFAFFLLPSFLKLLPQPQATEKIGIVGRYTLKDIPNDILLKISLGLTRVKSDGQAMPGLAKEWRVEDNGKTYVFTLADDLSWHDKSPILAKDINYNFKDVENEIVDDKTIRFKLKEPFAPFPVVVSKPVLKKGFIGAGEYRVEKISQNGDFVESISLESLNRSKTKLVYRFYPTEAAAKTALKLGEVRQLEGIIDPSGFENWRMVKIEPVVKYDRYLAIFFDTSKPPLSEKSFRQALAYAIPKENDKERVFSPLSPLSWAYNSDVKPYNYDLANAKKLLEKTEESGKKINIRLATSPSLLPEAEKIEKAWADLGIKTNIEALSDPLSMNFEALLAIQEISQDPDQYSLWHSTQQTVNITNFNNPRIDQLLEEGRRTMDKDKRKKIYYDFQRFIVEEVPVIFLYYPTTYTLKR